MQTAKQEAQRIAAGLVQVTPAGKQLLAESSQFASVAKDLIGRYIFWDSGPQGLIVDMVVDAGNMTGGDKYNVLLAGGQCFSSDTGPQWDFAD